MKNYITTSFPSILCWVLMLLETLPSASAQSNHENSWKLVKTNNKNEGWKLYKRRVPDSKVFEYKIKGKVNASVQAAQKAALDLVINPKYYKSPKGKEYGTFKIIEQNQKEYTIYSLMYGPFIFKDRDVVLKYELYQNTAGNEMGLRWQNIQKEGHEATKKIIRMPVDIGNWNFKKLDNSSCEATNILRFHPGGKMPRWMINMMIKSRLPEELKNLRIAAKEFETKD